MISDDQVEAALDYMRDKAPAAAQARAERAYVEEFRKVLKAQIMREHPGDPLGTQEAKAYSDKRYLDHLKVIKTAVFEDEQWRFRMAAAQAKLDAWRTMKANERKAMI